MQHIAGSFLPRPRAGRTVRFFVHRSKALGLASVAVAALAPPAAVAAPAAAAAATATPAYYAQLRSRLKWTAVQAGGRELRTLDPASRLLLARSAAQRAGLGEVGLDFRDVYGVISAETSWFPRDGMGRNGVVSQGLAQFEPATARALGVRDVHDPVEAVHAAATLLKEAAQWSAQRIARLQLEGPQRAARLREGVSIYYNLSSAARARWDGASTASLPLETQRHIRNVRAGIAQADRLAGGGGRIELPTLLAAAGPSPRQPESAAARSVPAGPRPPQPVGTIEWSGSGSDADARRSGKYVVWSNGTVSREGARVRWTSAVPPGRDG